MMSEKEELQYLYQLYLINGCTAKELERLFELIRTGKNDNELTELLSLTWDRTTAIPDTGLIPDFIPELNKEVQLNPVGKTYPFKKVYPFKNIFAAAAILLVIGTTYLFKADLFSSAAVHQVTAMSRNGERKQLQLTDGTKVWLSPNSKLSYPEKFGSAQRMVTLEGEAFFEVAHDSSHPFIIQTGQVSTTVLGTSFNISAYQQQTAINVTLVTGKVAVALKTADQNTEATLTNNQRASIDKTDAKIIKTDFPDAADFMNRRTGIFNYKGARLNDVIKDLELQYLTKIQIEADITNRIFYGSLDMNQPISQTLTKLSTVMEIKWKKDGGKYVIIK